MPLTRWASGARSWMFAGILIDPLNRLVSPLAKSSGPDTVTAGTLKTGSDRLRIRAMLLSVAGDVDFHRHPKFAEAQTLTQSA